MQPVNWVLAVAIVNGVAMSASAARGTPSAQAQTMATTIAPWWRMIERSFIAAAEAMPPDKWSFRPSGGAFDNVRTFAEQVKHVACANEAFFAEIAHKDPPPDCEHGGPNPAASKEQLIAYLQSTFAQGARALAELTPSNALDPASGRYGGDSTRLGLITLAIWHASDHYGQIVLYLRMNHIVPPASR
jgi:uncharacterized damage-inducible protein DinB